MLWKFLAILNRLLTLWKVRAICKSFQALRPLWKIYGHSGKFTGTLESFWSIWKALDALESFHTLRKVSRCTGIVSRHYKKFSDTLESLLILWKVSRYSKRFLHTVESILYMSHNIFNNLVIGPILLWSKGGSPYEFFCLLKFPIWKGFSLSGKIAVQYTPSGQSMCWWILQLFGKYFWLNCRY